MFPRARTVAIFKKNWYKYLVITPKIIL